MGINKKTWGTSGRKTILKNYNSLIPIVTWACIIIPGIVYTIYLEIKNSSDGMSDEKIVYLVAAGGSYAMYWLIVFVCWKTCVQQHLHRKADLVREENEFGERSTASKAWANASHVPYMTQQELGECEQHVGFFVFVFVRDVSTSIIHGTLKKSGAQQNVALAVFLKDGFLEKA